MLIGVISDIHNYLSDEARKALRGVDCILCAGDLTTQMVLTELECIAPTYAVCGNCDQWPMAGSLEPLITPLLDGVRFHIVHRPEDIGYVGEDVNVVIHGHTHVPREQYLNGVLYLNPGSPTRPRGGSNKSVVRLFVQKGAVKNIEFVSLP